MGIPIYYVIVKQFYNPQMVSIWEIVEVVDCNLEDIDAVYREKVAPRWVEGVSYSSFVFYREPPNPFRKVGSRSIVPTIEPQVEYKDPLDL